MSHQLLGQLGGPVTAVNVLGQAAQAGGETFLYFTSFFSIIIGLFNLFPFPALDGGRAAFLVVEGLRRRPLDPRREGYVHLVGLALLLCLILALTVRDVMHPIHLNAAVTRLRQDCPARGSNYSSVCAASARSAA